MSVKDGKRLPASVFKLDVERMRQGWYSDHYFNNIVRILSDLAAAGYRFRGKCPVLSERGISLSDVDVGNMWVDMQFFTKRAPYSIVAGVDHAIAMFKECTGHLEAGGRFVNTAEHLEIEAVLDGEKVKPWETVMRVRGRYRDFAFLETPTLGAMARRTRIATNVYRTLEAARGKPASSFFPRASTFTRPNPGTGTPTASRLSDSTWTTTRACIHSSPRRRKATGGASVAAAPWPMPTSCASCATRRRRCCSSRSTRRRR
jgi:hypothetical protein